MIINWFCFAKSNYLKDICSKLMSHIHLNVNVFFQTYAHPADELMPLSCKGRYRGSEFDRGDIDEALGK